MMVRQRKQCQGRAHTRLEKLVVAVSALSVLIALPAAAEVEFEAGEWSGELELHGDPIDVTLIVGTCRVPSHVTMRLGFRSSDEVEVMYFRRDKDNLLFSFIFDGVQRDCQLKPDRKELVGYCEEAEGVEATRNRYPLRVKRNENASVSRLDDCPRESPETGTSSASGASNNSQTRN